MDGQSVDISELEQLSQLGGDWRDVTSGQSPVLVIDLPTGQDSESSGIGTEVLGWLRSQPVPVIGRLTGTQTNQNTTPAGETGHWQDAVDLLLDDDVADADDSLETLISAIEAQPTAAAVLVQVTRVTSQLPVMEALAMESLAYATLQAGSAHRQWLAGRPAPRLTTLDEPVQLERVKDVLHIRLNSPGNRNALSAAMRDALVDAFELVIADNSLTGAVVTGNGPGFCSGGDLCEFGLADDPAAAHGIRQQRMPGRLVARSADRFHFQLHGSCVGAGIEIPAFAGRISATIDTVFQLPELRFGLIPGAGGCVSIPRRIGRHRMNQWALTGERLDAKTALAWGLIDAIVEETQT